MSRTDREARRYAIGYATFCVTSFAVGVAAAIFLQAVMR